MKTTMLLTVTALVMLTAGCAYTPPQDTRSTFFSPPVGSRLVLKQAITIPANNGWIYIQNGQLLKRLWDVDTYYGNCLFEMQSSAEQARTIEPDTFTVTRVIREEEDVMWGKPALVARVGEGGAPAVNFMVIMELHSARQPDVSRMTCQNWDDANDGQQLSIDQIRATLGDLFELQLPGN